MEELGFGIIGCGVNAPWHVAGIKAARGARLAAVCDIIPEKAQEFAAKHGAPRWYVDYHEMLENPEIDVVCICTPSGLHGEPTIAAAKAGKHVLCEKPLEVTREKMDAMIAACRGAGVKLGGIFQRRTYPTIQAVRRMIQDGKFGKMVLGGAYLKYYRSPEYYKSAGWRGTWELDGGGALMNQGVHGIDEILWLMGPVKSVFARCDHLVRDIEVEDTAVILVEYESGAYGIIEGTTSVYPGMSTRVEVHGELGTAIIDEAKITTLKFLGEEVDAVASEADDTGVASDPRAIATHGHEVLVQDMVDAILEDREPMIPGEEHRKAVDLILAIYESARTRKEVYLS